MSSNRKVFSLRSQQHEHLFREPERPNSKIKMTIQLEKKIDTVHKNLQQDLGRDNMAITVKDPATNIISVTGIPPEQGYNEKRILAVVKRYDKNAKELPQSIKLPK